MPIALIAFGMVLVLVSIPGGSVVYAVFGSAVFAGLVMYDFQPLRVANELDSAPLPAASIFLDILNRRSVLPRALRSEGAVDGPHRATDDAPTLMTGGMADDEGG